MLIVKGKAVSFDLTDKTKIDAPADHGMMHDPTGRTWKKTSVLVAPFKKLGDETDGDKYSRDYLGHSHLTHAGDVRLPPKELGAWQYEGEVERIWYTRTGKKNGGKRFQHKFNAIGFQRLVRGKGKARLYSRGNIYRLELSRGAQLDSRGFVHP